MAPAAVLAFSVASQEGKKGGGGEIRVLAGGVDSISSLQDKRTFLSGKEGV